MTRRALYAEAWAEPMTTVAARYGVSSSFLARVCERLRVPRPPRGYWAKLAVGKAPRTPALPPARPGDEQEWQRGGSIDHRRPRTHHALEQPSTSNALSGSVDVAEAARPYGRGQQQVLAGAREHLLAGGSGPSGYLKPSKRRLVDIVVSEATLARALTFARALFRALEVRGHHVTLAPRDQGLTLGSITDRADDQYGYEGARWRPDRPTVVYVGSVAIALTIFELRTETEVVYADGRYVPARSRSGRAVLAGKLSTGWTHRRLMPAGLLCLRASSPYALATWHRDWTEQQPRDLMDKISGIAEALEASAPALAALVEEGQRQHEARLREWEAEQERWRREEAERQRIAREAASRDALRRAIAAWTDARSIESFFREVEGELSSLEPDGARAMRDLLARGRALLGPTDALEALRRWAPPESK